MAEFAGDPALEGVDPEYREYRTTFEAYEIDGTRLAMIADEDDKHAWIQSGRFEQVKQ